MNLDKCNRLPADLKVVIDNHSGMNIAKDSGRAWDKAEQPSQELAKQRGNEFCSLPTEEGKRWGKATRSVTAAWLKTMEMKLSREPP